MNKISKPSSSFSKNDNDNTLKLENPQKLPLDKLYIKVYNKYGARDIKAIDPYWLGDYTYPSYFPIPHILSIENIHKWNFKNTSYLKALKLFFNMPYQEFWSHVVYEPAFSIVIESFLEGAVPPYLPQPEHENILPLYSDIYSLVFAIYKKLLTCHHSETEYMEPATVGAFLYDNSVIKIESLVSLIRIYGHSDDGPLKDLILMTFNLLPLLNDHLQICSNHFYDVFESISAEAYECDTANTETTTHLTLLLYDTTFCLHMFMKLYPPLKDVCLESGFISKIVYSFEEEIPLIAELVNIVIIGEQSSARQYVRNAKIEMLEICSMMLCSCFDLLLQSQDIKWLTIYLESIEVISKNRKFAASYNAKYSLYSQLEMLKMIFPDYMQKHESYEKLLFLFAPSSGDDSDDQGASNSNEYYLCESDDEVDLSEDDEDNSSTAKKNIILDSKIKDILEVFPYYGDGFIEKCLRFYSMDTQKVIESILSIEGLPAELAQLDIDLPRIPPETDPKEIKSVLEYKGKKPDKHKDLNELLNDKSHLIEQKERYQKYQNEEWYDSLYNDDYESDEDEYNVPLYEGGDILDNLPKRRNIVNEEEENKIEHKPGLSKETRKDDVKSERKNDIRNERKDDRNQKKDDRNQRQWINSQPQRDNRRNTSNYTNGTNSRVNNSEQDNTNKPSSSNKGRGEDKFQNKQWSNSQYQNQPRGNPNVSNGVPSEDEEDEDEDSHAGYSKPRDPRAFCEDPAVIRARREAHYQQNRPNNKKTKDVVGNPKGEGQDKNVLISRDKKNKNKSSGANHNRRAGAQFKRSRGMFPS